MFSSPLPRRVLNQPESLRSRLESQGLGLSERLVVHAKKLQVKLVQDLGRDYTKLKHTREFSEFESLAHGLVGLDSETLEYTSAIPERRCFWINLYNALSLHGTFDFEVEHSVREVPGFFDRSAYQVGSHILSLNDIEHGILRSNRRAPYRLTRPFQPWDERRGMILPASEFDPRVHFALHCGSRSCPPIQFYRPPALDRQLELAAQAFIEAETRLGDGGAVEMSRIFDWYATDFEPSAGAFVARFLPEGPLKARCEAPHVKIRFREYNWAL